MDAFLGQAHFEKRFFELLAHGDEPAPVKGAVVELRGESALYDLLDVSCFTGPVAGFRDRGEKMEILVLGLKRPPFVEVQNFLLVRGVAFPSLRYNNRTDSLDIYEGRLNKALEHYRNVLQRSEDVHTGLFTGTEDNWQFSVLIFICSQVARSADDDLKKLLEDYQKKSGLAGLS